MLAEVPLLLQLIFLFILGTAIGSFLGVLSDRLPEERSINGRSHCVKCKKTLQWYDLFPLVSFILLGGMCRYCKAPIPPNLFIIEIVTGIAFVLTWLFIPIEGLIPKVLHLGIISALIVIFFADWKHQIIPDSMHIVLLLLALPLQSNIITSIFCGLIIMLPILVLFLVTKGRGMGFGDVKLAAVIGFMFGIKGGLIVLYLGFITGAIAGIFLILKGRKTMKQTIAFGPFLVVGMVVMLFFNQQLLEFSRRFFPW